MKIFICWSGKWGKNAAEQIKEWRYEDVLKDLLKDSRDVLVSEDIAKGAVWFEELSGFLDQASVALVCLTRDALRSAWVHYEVGAIAKALREKRASKRQVALPLPGGGFFRRYPRLPSLGQAGRGRGQALSCQSARQSKPSDSASHQHRRSQRVPARDRATQSRRRP